AGAPGRAELCGAECCATECGLRDAWIRHVARQYPLATGTRADGSPRRSTAATGQRGAFLRGNPERERVGDPRTRIVGLAWTPALTFPGRRPEPQRELRWESRIISTDSVLPCIV